MQIDGNYTNPHDDKIEIDAWNVITCADALG